MAIVWEVQGPKNLRRRPLPPVADLRKGSFAWRDAVGYQTREAASCKLTCVQWPQRFRLPLATLEDPDGLDHRYDADKAGFFSVKRHSIISVALSD
jgi:hypothetical protein